MSDSMTFNQFQKELRDRKIEPQNAYLFSLLYERMTEMAKQLDMMANIVTGMANTMGSFVELHGRTQEGLLNLEKYGKTAGVEVSSVVPDPSEDNKH